MYDGDKRSARQLAKVILEVHLGRRLTENETVDHVDNDKSNDSIANLQILSREANAGKDRKVVVTADCAYCGKVFELSAGQRSTRNAAKRKFCSRACVHNELRSIKRIK